MPPIIEIHKLGKKYPVADMQPYLSLRDVISQKAKNIFRKSEKSSNEFWALQNINLEIERGERVGIIGRNGAGKSTLLKILSRITPPTTGEIKLCGRVASLLEVGTGFHPELTGRENIYLNGSILGLTKKEIDKKLDEIIDFSGVEKFIDAPLKHYSSGMQLRLAFSVAAHLEPEILLIDEVLAVGDLEFQKKCLAKMEEISIQSNRTIFFVSHDLSAVANLTQTVVLLDEGKIEAFGKTADVIQKYLARFRREKNTSFPEFRHRPYFKNIELTTSHQQFQSFGCKLKINVSLMIPDPVNALEFSYQICNESAEPVIYNWFSTSKELATLIDKTGMFAITIEIPSLKLYKGHYYFRFYLSDPRGKIVYQTIEHTLPFEVQMQGIYNEWGWQGNVCKYIEDCRINVEGNEFIS